LRSLLDLKINAIALLIGSKTIAIDSRVGNKNLSHSWFDGNANIVE
jgi:hypothetical protein